MNISKPSGYFMYHQVILYPQSVFMCCAWRQITALQSSSWLRFPTDQLYSLRGRNWICNNISGYLRFL